MICPQANPHVSSIIENRQQRARSTTGETSQFPTHTTGLLKLAGNLVYFCLNARNKSSAASHLSYTESSEVLKTPGRPSLYPCSEPLPPAIEVGSHV